MSKIKPYVYLFLALALFLLGCYFFIKHQQKLDYEQQQAVEQIQLKAKEEAKKESEDLRKKASDIVEKLNEVENDRALGKAEIKALKAKLAGLEHGQGKPEGIDTSQESTEDSTEALAVAKQIIEKQDSQIVNLENDNKQLKLANNLLEQALDKSNEALKRSEEMQAADKIQKDALASAVKAAKRSGRLEGVGGGIALKILADLVLHL